MGGKFVQRTRNVYKGDRRYTSEAVMRTNIEIDDELLVLFIRIDWYADIVKVDSSGSFVNPNGLRICVFGSRRERHIRFLLVLYH